MFDVGFGELLVIAILGLLVLGPERLPVAVRHISLWLGRLKRSYQQVKLEIEKEIGADEIRRQLHNEEIMQNLNASKEEMQQLAEDVNQPIKPSSPAQNQADTEDDDERRN